MIGAHKGTVVLMVFKKWVGLLCTTCQFPRLYVLNAGHLPLMLYKTPYINQLLFLNRFCRLKAFACFGHMSLQLDKGQY